MRLEKAKNLFAKACCYGRILYTNTLICYNSKPFGAGMPSLGLLGPQELAFEVVTIYLLLNMIRPIEMQLADYACVVLGLGGWPTLCGPSYHLNFVPFWSDEGWESI